MTDRPVPSARFEPSGPEAPARRVVVAVAVAVAALLVAGTVTAALHPSPHGSVKPVVTGSSERTGATKAALQIPHRGSGAASSAAAGSAAAPAGTVTAPNGTATTWTAPSSYQAYQPASGSPVGPTSPGSPTSPTASPVLTCLPGQSCLEANAFEVGSPLGHVASGFLHDTDLANASVVKPLAPTSWRVAVVPEASGALDFSAFDAARRSGATTITVVVSDAWYWASNNGCGVPSSTCGAETPWGHFGAYGSWIEGYVRQLEKSGRHPTYWEIQNEPDAVVFPGNYFDATDAGGMTISDQLAQFATAYHAIRAADPAAKVLGPSLADYRGARDGRLLDMGTFLSFSAAQGLHWDGLSWHENVTSPTDPQPEDVIAGHVATTRRLLAGFPSLGHPVIAITEYGDEDDRMLPGWIVGDMAALEDSGVAFAERTCAVALSDPSGANECTRQPSTLDGLLLGDGATTAAYWTYASYASLVGRRIAVASPSPSLSILGVAMPDGGVRLLVGRHATCTQPVNPDCPFALPLPTPVSVPLTLAVPWAGPTLLKIQRIPNVRGPVSGLLPVSSATVVGVGGVIHATLPGMWDGDAMVVTAEPAN